MPFRRHISLTRAADTPCRRFIIADTAITPPLMLFFAFAIIFTPWR